MKMIQDIEKEVNECVSHLINSNSNEELLEYAKTLMKIGVRDRGSILPRGSSKQSAKNRLPDQTKLPLLINKLRTAHKSVCRALVLALAEWGDESVVSRISEMMQDVNTDMPTKRSCINALRIIGGVEAVTALEWATNQEDLKLAANWAKLELESGGTFDFSEGRDCD